MKKLMIILVTGVIFFCCSNYGDRYKITSIANEGMPVDTHQESPGTILPEKYEVIPVDVSDMSDNPEMFIDIQNLGKGKVSFKAVAKTPKKDIMVHDKNNVSFFNYWVDERNGYIYCPCKSKC
jgi:hypothetical protein